MTNVVQAAFIFFILLVGGTIAFSSLIKTHEINAGNCNAAANGTIENCSLSDNDYRMLNNSYAQASNTFTTFSSLNWVTGLAVLVGVLLVVAAIKK